MELIDTHCHIDVEAFDTDRDEVLKECQKVGVTRIVVPGIEVETWERLGKMCDELTGLYPAYGLHPVYADQHADDDLVVLETRLKTNNPIAVGEIGLDFLFKKDLSELDKERQQSLFEAQLGIAQSTSLPVILHVRKAHDVVLSTLRRIPVNGGICHAFNGSIEQAHRYIDMGFKLGFGGMLTYERSHKLHRLAQQLPIESIVLETDAPDMTGSSHHGERNSPEYLPESLAALALLREEDVETIAEQTTANAKTVLSFS
jgi:TatD DNase family protein